MQGLLALARISRSDIRKPGRFRITSKGNVLSSLQFPAELLLHVPTDEFKLKKTNYPASGNFDENGINYSVRIRSLSLRGAAGYIDMDPADKMLRELPESGWKGSWICIEKKKLKNLFPGETFYFELINCPVYTDLDSARPEAVITGIMETGAHPVLRCNLPEDREILIPWTDSVVTLIKNPATGFAEKAVVRTFYDYDPERI